MGVSVRVRGVMGRDARERDDARRRERAGRTVPPSRCSPWREKLGTMSKCSSSARKWTSFVGTGSGGRGSAFERFGGRTR